MEKYSRSSIFILTFLLVVTHVESFNDSDRSAAFISKDANHLNGRDQICKFTQSTTIYGDFDRLELHNNKENCASHVKEKYPGATGVLWRESKQCYAMYGNTLTSYPNDDYWACLIPETPFWEFKAYGLCDDRYPDYWSRSQLECQASCIGDPKCVGISYLDNGPTAICYICHSESLDPKHSPIFYKRPFYCELDFDCPLETPVCNQYGYCYGCNVDDSGCNDPFRPHCLNGFCAECKEDIDCSLTKSLCASGICSLDVTFTKMTSADCHEYYGSFGTIELAEDICSHDSECEAIRVPFCHTDNNALHLCPIGSTYYNSHTSTCIYNKTRIMSLEENTEYQP